MAILRVSPGTSGTNSSVPDLPVTAVEITLVGFIIVVALYFGQAVFVPLALAVILSFVLAPPVRVLRRLGLPNSPSVILVVVLTFAVFFGIGTLIAQQVASLGQELPRYQLTLTDKVKALKLAAADSGGALERATQTQKDLQ
jgi:predicted PurR-regulated permease PerM